MRRLAIPLAAVFLSACSAVTFGTPTPAPSVGGAPSNPIPLGQWVEIAPNAKVRLVNVESHETLEGHEPKPGLTYWLFSIEGRYEGAADSLYSFSDLDYAVLDSRRQIVRYYVVLPKGDDAFGATVYGGGSTSGKVGLLADAVEVLMYYRPSKTIHFAVR